MIEKGRNQKLDLSQGPKSTPLPMTLFLWPRFVRTDVVKHDIVQELGFVLWIAKIDFLSHAPSRQSDGKRVCPLGKT